MASSGEGVGRVDLDRVVCLDDLERAAGRVMDRQDFDYFAGGAETESTLRANASAFADVTLWPRVLVDVRDVDTSTSAPAIGLGRKLRTPLLVAPVAMQSMAHPDGERAAVRACASRGVPYCAAQQATTSVERIARACEGGGIGDGGGARMWFQLYVRAATAALARRAALAGATAIVVTVDAPTLGRRERDVRNGFKMRDGLKLANVDHGGGNDSDSDSSESGERPSSSDASAAQKRIAKRVGDRDASLTWSSLIPWLKSIVPALPIILKGVMTREDAALAVAHGVDGVWVSNHGGRQLDGAPSTLRALAEVVAGVNDVRNGNATSVTQTVTENVVPVVFDGGVRRGSDVLKALALGADVVAIGRPVAWGLACGGEAGVRKAIDVLTEELESSMRLAGVTSARDAREKGIARAAWTSPRAPTSKL